MEPVVQAWLTRQCELIAGVSRGVVVLSTQDGGGEVVACWPPETAAPDLATLAQVAGARRAIVGREPDPAAAPEEASTKHVQVAVPVCWLPGRAAGVAVEVTDDSAGGPEEIAAQLRCAAAGLEVAAAPRPESLSLALIVELVDVALGHDHNTDTAVATELATRLGCERVSIGFLHRGQCRVAAVSHSAQFREQTQLVRSLAGAMDEACDQDARVVYPLTGGTGDAALRITRAHQQLVENHGSGAACSVPMARADRIVGAITFEWPRGRTLAPAAVDVCESVARSLGPALEIKRSADARLLDRGRDQLRELAVRVFGPGHPTAKTIAVASLLALAWMALAHGTYRVSARATLEGRIQRAVVAGFDGYISQANARAGDLVTAGQILGRLDQRDLQLEKRKWTGRKAQIRKEYREAFAGHDRSQVSILSAKIAQADAELDLLDEQLERTLLVAPFAGVVVKGDLSQSLGSPVEKGEVLFQVAPLDGYRIMLQVDERDIADVSVGNRGKLALSAMPGRPLPFTVERVTPVATGSDGHNYFRVEARLDRRLDALRPGMEGIAKIAIEPRRLLWIWTHGLTDWLRLWAWSWWP
ncbi:MAG: HlyD family efflux transporter periplasmic adaptor subunit [Deltaproteobacteria bacterium]|nr:HlyD family efflux transporter periplasmic adaptor subunit [Deltaproteobacteria bacterium]MBW2415492.1 HlyD family efflux transporter periplasmic adaptor subunit [Deltaproteobacteria bacterium]